MPCQQQLTMAPSVGLMLPQDPNGHKGIFSLLAKAIGVFAAVFFVVCMPMGDPESLCQQTEDIEIQANCSGGSMQSYACSLHAVLTNAATSTNSILKHSSQFMACVMLNALYDAKMKFYTMLQKVDKEDLCATVVCAQERDASILTKCAETSPDKKETADKQNFCNCNRKYCRKHY